ncbi:MAG TPA: non-homologous end-joining DNA ligase [Thermoanaerobaculia bacterium]|nr:non-homologous end-joining DNA ligase [Thermoanaerobaculia bacterium]
MRIEKDVALSYYKSIAKTILPHLRNRPLSFKRWTDEIGAEFFWEKDAPSFTPTWVKRFPVPRREGGPPIDYIVCNDTRTLTWLASVGGFELHPFLHKVPRIDAATHVVFDLDPGSGADIRHCAKVALLLRDALQLDSFAKVSGSKGIQVYVPLNGNATHEMTETFARMVAEELARAYPKLVVAKMAKSLRHGKVFIDWSQNADYKTTVAVYSLRAATGLVSMPVRWEELAKPRELHWTPEEALARVKKEGDLFRDVLKLKQNVGRASGRRSERTSEAARPRGGRAEARPTFVLPKPSSQSGRRLFLVVKTEMGNELWLDMRGKFKRFILRPDREGGGRLIAMPAGEFAIEAAYYRAEVPARWRGRVTIDDSGAYEIVQGSFQRGGFDLWFRGKVMSGAWRLEASGERHRSWRLTPR